MKIICVDNFDRDTVSDFLVAENIGEYYGKLITEFLNEKLGGEHSPHFYRLESDDYKLYKFIP